MMKQKIFITGGLGYIGTMFAKEALKRDVLLPILISPVKESITNNLEAVNAVLSPLMETSK